VRGRLAWHRCGPPVPDLIHRRSEAMWDVPYNHKYEHDRQHEPQATARAVAPVPAVAPSWQAAQEQHDQDDQQEQTHGCFLPLVWSIAAAVDDDGVAEPDLLVLAGAISQDKLLLLRVDPFALPAAMASPATAGPASRTNAATALNHFEKFFVLSP
jgi:hypothetical protein